MPPDLALSIFMPPEVMSVMLIRALANSFRHSRFWQSCSWRGSQCAVQRKAEFLQPHKNDQSAAPVPTDCGKTVVSILLAQPTADDRWAKDLDLRCNRGIPPALRFMALALAWLRLQ
jgi:hypothetical protein